MVCVEVEDNLLRLSDFRAKAHQAAIFSSGHPLSAVQEGDALRHNVLPALSHVVWGSLTALIPTALTPEEIRRVFRFHAEVDELVAIKERDDLAPSEHRRVIEDAIARIIESGNPLRPRRRDEARP